MEEFKREYKRLLTRLNKAEKFFLDPAIDDDKKLKFVDEFNSSKNPQDLFTKCWVSIESYSKMLGDGLSFNLIKKNTSLNDNIFKIVDPITNEIFYFTAINKNNDKIDNVFFKI